MRRDGVSDSPLWGGISELEIAAKPFGNGKGNAFGARERIGHEYFQDARFHLAHLTLALGNTGSISEAALRLRSTGTNRELSRSGIKSPPIRQVSKTNACRES